MTTTDKHGNQTVYVQNVVDRGIGDGKVTIKTTDGRYIVLVNQVHGVSRRDIEPGMRLTIYVYSELTETSAKLVSFEICPDMKEVKTAMGTDKSTFHDYEARDLAKRIVSDLVKGMLEKLPYGAPWEVGGIYTVPRFTVVKTSSGVAILTGREEGDVKAAAIAVETLRQLGLDVGAFCVSPSLCPKKDK